MNNDKIKKFENKERLQELRPMETLKKVGFKEDMILCDIGAGTGIFAIPATEISNKEIYALEKSDDMIEILNTRIVEKSLKNLKVKKVESEILPLEDNICDMVVMITVLHHIEDKESMLSEIKRISKEKGKLLIIEFHKESTHSDGPKVEERISKEELKEMAMKNNLKIIDNWTMGDNFYAFVFEV